MDEKNVLGFKNACRNYFYKVDLTSLRSYGRELQLRNPTTMRKEDLVEEILKVLCGEIVPQRNKRGAPIKQKYLNENILKTVAHLQKEYLYGENAGNSPENTENTPKRTENAPVLAESMKESGLEPLQFVVRFSLLNEEQRELFFDFLKSL